MGRTGSRVAASSVRWPLVGRSKGHMDTLYLVRHDPIDSIVVVARLGIGDQQTSTYQVRAWRLSADHDTAQHSRASEVPVV